MNMVVGQTQAIQLLDQNGVPITNPTWSIADPSIAAIVPPVNQGDPTLLQANAIGNTTLTGTSPDNRTGTAQVSVLAGTSLPIGTVQWEVPSLTSSPGGPGITNIVQSLRIDDTTPDFYVFDQGANGGSGAFRAFTADGQQKWMFTPSAPPNEELALLSGDDQGGFIYLRDDSSDQMMLGRVDENGNPSWLLSAPGIALIAAPNVAIHPDGTIYFVQPDYLNTGKSPTAVVALDGTSGQIKFAIPLPTGSFTGTDYTLLDDPAGGNGGDGYPAVGGQYCTPGTSTAAPTTASFGKLTISSDGTVYLPISTLTLSYDAMPCDPSPDPNHPGYPHLVKLPTDGMSSVTSYLQVMVIHSDGTYSLRQLDSTSSSGPGNGAELGPSGAFANGLTGNGATPDGNGGTLLALNNSGGSVPSAFYHDTGSAVSKLNLSFNPAGEILTGEDGTAYLSGTTTGSRATGAIAAINTSSNTINWTDSLSTTGNLQQLLAVPAAGGVIFEDAAGHLNTTDPNGVITPLFRGSNGTDAGPTNTTNANYWTLGTWFASLNDGSAGAVIGNNTPFADSERAELGGNAQKQSKPPVCHVLRCVLAPASDITIPNKFVPNVQVREVRYEVFSLKNGILIPLVGDSRIRATKIAVLETNPTNTSTLICDWNTVRYTPECKSPNSIDGPGQYTDDYTAGNTGINTVTQQFVVDRGFVPIYWPCHEASCPTFPTNTWYPAWSQNATVNPSNPDGAFILQNNPDMSTGAGASCQGGCSVRQPDGTP
jgi:hypothetical protein